MPSKLYKIFGLLFAYVSIVRLVVWLDVSVFGRGAPLDGTTDQFLITTILLVTFSPAALVATISWSTAEVTPERRWWLAFWLIASLLAMLEYVYFFDPGRLLFAFFTIVYGAFAFTLARDLQ
ncbi:hypothetical protein [Fuerstiella marisgermanici]|uniref:Uncharacterized protein n=1 Tax=Fuerstiella marisgermanici TaxID=1891926 RepID=A0A1P8WBM8_9PLAN|nr:hypothetical protein [Fuerstiella marisgermanici]APZ91454.1 hypothetical protein Fuma_01042 [Fuerstiella marisgermanici]